MMDQADRLRELVKKKTEKKNKAISKKTQLPRIITVTSGKGGVGKSNFVVSLSIYLQRNGNKVLIFDADMGMGNDDVIMGFLPKYNVYDVIFNDKKIEEVVTETQFGVKLLPAGNDVSKFEEVTHEQRTKFIDKLSILEDVDYIIIDTGAGINRSVLAFIACCEELIVVTTPEPTSLTDAYSLLKAVNYFKLKDDIELVVNRAANEEDGKHTYDKFSSVVRRFLNIKLNYLGNMSDDKKVSQSVRMQQPFLVKYPYAKVSLDLENIANKIMGHSGNKKGTTVQGLFRKLFNIFS
ncbi:MinD/ParA family protein [Clostridium fermenticellae]|uniref:MinD/ParA family protein n=1 Tax=Clostridium fermenticellae TaxID=2068654 RepID=A0A386H4M1_9CLOT|nr:MinD/ParA family protein [Clostridium fermenticellae]AYD40669.1 MinD/ParA family protein [Clostridium fermenticellae]